MTDAIHEYEIAMRAVAWWKSTTGRNPYQARDEGTHNYDPQFLEFLRENAENPEFIEFLTWDMETGA
jgi:hypothetical protein